MKNLKHYGSSIILAVGLAIILSSCAGKYSIAPRPQPPSRAVFQDGIGTVISEKNNVVVIRPTDFSIAKKETEEFQISVLNRTDSEFLFSTENIVAQYWTANTPGKSLKVYSYEEMVEKEKSRQKWAAIAEIFQGVSEAISASSEGYSTRDGYVSGYGGSANYSETAYDHGAAESARHKASDRQIARIQERTAQKQANLDYLANTMLKKQTVFPGKYHGGVVAIETPSFSETGKLNFIVSTGNEVHKAVFLVEKR